MAKNKGILIALAVVFIKGIFTFIKKAYTAGRTVELFLSSAVLIGTYYALWCAHPSMGWSYIIPVILYSLYWVYLFSHEKITSVGSNPMWADRSWWWNLDGWEFEEETAKVFRLNGYKAEVTKKTGDGGADIILYKDGIKIAAQCKHYRNPVSVKVARELNGIKDDLRADKLLLIASSGVTKSCTEFLSNKPYFKVMDLEDIIRIGLRPISHK